MLLNRIRHSLDAAETSEQAGFRRRFSTIDHLQTINELIEKSREFHLPLIIAFVDYEKAFDSIEIDRVWTALRQQGVHEKIVMMLQHIYSVARSEFFIGNDSIEVNIERGVRQGDAISPSLFTACLREVMRSLDWDQFGINIDGQYLSYLAFADDIALISQNADQIQSMLNQLADASANVGLKINISKTKVVSSINIQTPLEVQVNVIETVDQFVYLGQLVSIPRNHNREISRLIRSG